jgi:hypothetical protein
MFCVLRNFWRDQCGAVLMTDWIFLATVLVLGLLPAMLGVQNRRAALCDSRQRLDRVATAPAAQPPEKP